MQKALKNALLVSLSMCTIFSCREPELKELSEESNNVEVVDFKGEKAKIPFDFPKELLSPSQAAFDGYYKKVSGSDVSKTSGSEYRITYEELLPILVKHLSKYPRLNSEDEISASDLNRIFKDFPDIKTLEQADAKRMVIFDFYQTLAKKEIVADVIKLESMAGRGGRTADVSPPTLSTPEKNHLLANPGYAQWYVQAANDASSLVLMVYQVDKEDTKGNAFKHGVWNALSIRYILKGAPASENQAIDFTQDGTSKHEQDNNGNQKHNSQAAMDLHNNMSARVWMESETKWGIGPFRKMPNVEDIINTMASRADSGPLQNGTVILNAFGGDNANILYDNMYGPYQHLVHMIQ